MTIENFLFVSAGFLVGTILLVGFRLGCKAWVAVQKRKQGMPPADSFEEGVYEELQKMDEEERNKGRG